MKISSGGLMTRNIPKEVKALFAALQLRGGHTEQLHCLNDSEWESLLSFCERSYLTFALLQLQDDGFPGWAGERLKNNAADNAKRFERVRATYKEVAATLEGSDIQFVLMKGFSKCPEYVLDPRLRMQGDIDLYCPAGEIHRACSALSTIGYYPDQAGDYDAADHLPTLFRDEGWTWHGEAFDPQMPLPVELHFCLWNETAFRFSVPELDRFWERRVLRSLEDLTFPAFCEIDSLGYYAIHALRDLLDGHLTLHHAYDIAVFLHRHAEDSALWASWLELHGDTLRSMQAIAFGVAKTWFDCNTSPEVQTEIDNLPLAIKNWLRSFVYSPLESMFHPNKDRVWLHLSLLNSLKEKQFILRKVLWPARIPPVETTAAGFDEYGQPRKDWPTQQLVRYLFYLVSRTVHHTRVLPPALWHGFRWWASQRELSRQFWIFLASAFFLTWACPFISCYLISS
ncbi:MAG: nucleotidyltransferase family protein [Terracidiphilus sp.]|jgi:hypothetical protein